MYNHFSDLVLCGRVLSVPLATQSKTKTSSSSNSTHQRPGCKSYKISTNIGVDQSDIGKYHIEQLVSTVELLEEPYLRVAKGISYSLAPSGSV